MSVGMSASHLISHVLHTLCVCVCVLCVCVCVCVCVIIV